MEKGSSYLAKKSNRADIDSIYKQIIKTIDFEDITKESLTAESIHLLTMRKY